MAGTSTKKPNALGPALRNAVLASADPARAEHGLALVLAASSGPLAAVDAEHARILAALFAGSDAMGQLLVKHPEWAYSLLTPEKLEYPRQTQGLLREVQAWLQPALKTRDYAGAFSRLRQFKQQQMLRIAARDLARLGHAPGLTREIANVADVCLDSALTLCRAQLTERLGSPYHQDARGDWQPTGFAVLGLGKLGGQELNYSSDVDVVFVYSEEGQVFKEPPGRRAERAQALSSHQYFRRLAEALFAEITRATPDGILFRMDLRLRPEGEAGPLVRSLASYESYYAQWGQTWERMMLIKARGVAGDVSLAAEFLEMVQPFRYPRSLGEGVLREIAAMKTRIENEVVRSGELARNVKLGRGGIREIEFIVQTAQILNAGRAPFLQGGQTLPLLEKLAQYNFLTRKEAHDLAAAYCFLRDVEHRVQMEQNLQTHTIPLETKARTRLARLMGFTRLPEFEAELRRHNERVREIYEKQLQSEAPEVASPYPGQFRGAEAEWKRLLSEHGFRDVDRSLKLLTEFAHGPGYVHVSQRTTQLAMGLLPRLFELCPGRLLGQQEMPSTGVTSRRPKRPQRGPDAAEAVRAGRSAGAPVERPRTVLSDPDRVLARLDSFITAYAARAMMFETWTSHPQLFELLLLLFDRSEFLAEIAIRVPDLVDDLVLSGRLGRAKSAAEILADLRHGKDDADQRLWLRRYHQAEFMRIGLRSILGLSDPEQNFVELTALADACLQYALEVAVRRAKLKTCPLVVIGLGKLGGQELTYGSDLDILFVAEDQAKRRLPQLQKLAVDILDLLGSKTELGAAFLTDARLRPDGEKGLLVNTLSAYEEYYRHRAQLWEIQALTRTRPVAGPPALGEAFQRLAAAMTDFRKFTPKSPPVRPRQARPTSVPSTPAPACFTPEWKQQIARMRWRIEKERTPAGQDALAFKTGSGGLMDAEFIAQTCCLERGWQEANTLRALSRMRAEQVIPAAEANKLIENYGQLRRLECILRRWSFEGETVLPADPAPYYRVSVRCGFTTSDDFRAAVAGWRNAIREVYRRIFPA